MHGFDDRLLFPKRPCQGLFTVNIFFLSRGFDRSKIETYGYGKTMPAKSCPDQKSRPALIECLAPNRRVEIEIAGTRR